jgi:glutamate synthase (NADPH/NADH) large chain/glutamate synthase (ferredoxin)
MIFLPKEHASRLACEQEMERAIKAEGQVLLGWRDVPVNRDMPMSPTVRKKEPILRQVFIGRGNDVIVQDALERKLYVIRKTASANIQALKLKHSKEYYVPSMSSRTVVYKGLLLADQVGKYYRTCRTSAASRPSAWCTSVSPPTPSPSGRWPTPTAMWRTTVKSTPSRATTTG